LPCARLRRGQTLPGQSIASLAQRFGFGPQRRANTFP
jgi:hypothetical protein